MPHRRLQPGDVASQHFYEASLDSTTIACEYGLRRLHEGAITPAKRKACDVEATRQWVGRGDIGTVTFDEAATWLRLDPEPTRAILAAVRA
jgi:hypothetical protein